jgi:hypothetical protein
MARELVENKEIGESDDSVGRSLGQLRTSLPTRIEEEPPNGPVGHLEVEVPAILPLTAEPVLDTAILEAASLPRRPSRKAAAARPTLALLTASQRVPAQCPLKGTSTPCRYQQSLNSRHPITSASAP